MLECNFSQIWNKNPSIKTYFDFITTGVHNHIIWFWFLLVIFTATKYVHYCCFFHCTSLCKVSLSFCSPSDSRTSSVNVSRQSTQDYRQERYFLFIFHFLSGFRCSVIRRYRCTGVQVNKSTGLAVSKDWMVVSCYHWWLDQFCQRFMFVRYTHIVTHRIALFIVADLLANIWFCMWKFSSKRSELVLLLGRCKRLMHACTLVFIVCTVYIYICVHICAAFVHAYRNVRISRQVWRLLNILIIWHCRAWKSLN